MARFRIFQLSLAVLAASAAVQFSCASSASRFFGSRTSPIQVDGPSGERTYLNRLICPNGNPPGRARLGSYPGRHGHMIDLFELDCCGEIFEVHFDMYHQGQPDQALRGFQLLPEDPCGGMAFCNPATPDDPASLPPDGCSKSAVDETDV